MNMNHDVYIHTKIVFIIQFDEYNYTHRFFHEITNLKCKNNFRIICDIDKKE